MNLPQQIRVPPNRPTSRIRAGLPPSWCWLNRCRRLANKLEPRETLPTGLGHVQGPVDGGQCSVVGYLVTDHRPPTTLTCAEPSAPAPAAGSRPRGPALPSADPLRTR